MKSRLVILICLVLALAFIASVWAAPPQQQVKLIVYLKAQPFFEAAALAKQEYRPRLEALQAEMQAAVPYPLGAKIYRTREEEEAVVRSAPPLTAAQQEELHALAQQMDATLQEMRSSAMSRAVPEVASSQEPLAGYIASLGGVVLDRLSFPNALAVAVPAEQVEAIKRHPDVAEVAENRVFEVHLNSSPYSIGADTWWDNGYTGGIWDFGVIDSGVDHTHPALSSHPYVGQAFLAAAGWPSRDNTPDDVNGHGTHVAGIASSTDTTFRGVAYGHDRIVNGKAGCDDDGEDGGYARALESDAMQAADWAVFTASADVVNFSYGGIPSLDDGDYARFWDALSENALVLVTMSAGNDNEDGSPTVHSPCIAYNVLCVANVDEHLTTDRSDDEVHSTSSRGPSPGWRNKPDIAAPGTYIYSTYNIWEEDGDFIARTGTSMAAPHVAGASLLLMDYGVYDPLIQKAILINTAEKRGFTGWDPAWGWGYLDLTHAYFHRSHYFLDHIEPAPTYRLYKGTVYDDDLATLVWPRRVVYTGGSFPSTYYTLSNLNLYMYNESDNTLVDHSVTSNENVEQVEADATYDVVLKVDALSSSFDGASTEWYSLATEENFVAATLSLNAPPKEYRVATGTTFVVTLAVINNGSVRAHNVSVQLYLPSGVTLISGSNPQDLGSITPGGFSKTAWWQLRLDSVAAIIPAAVTSYSYGEHTNVQTSIKINYFNYLPIILKNS